MNRKKQVISAALSLLLSTGISAGSILPTFAAENDGQEVTAGEEQKGVALDEKNFPDEGFRSYVKGYDWNKDGYLSDDEIESITDIDIYDSEEGATIRNLQGAELLPNLENVRINADCIETINFSYISQVRSIEIYGTAKSGLLKNIDLTPCTKLERLSIDSNKVNKLDLSKCGNLKWVDLYACSELESVNVNGCKNLTDLSISYCGKLNVINLDSCSNLDTIDITKADITSLNLTACKDTLRILGLTNCKKLKDVDITGCKKLESLGFYGCDNMKETDVEFLKKQLPELNRLELNSSSKPKIDLTGFEKLSVLFVDDGDVEAIKFDPKQKFVGINIGHNEIKELDLEEIIAPDTEDESAEIYIQRQTPTITIPEDKVKNNMVALKDLFSDVSRVTIKKGSGYTYDDAKKVITFKSAKNLKFNYVWDTKYDGETLDGTAYIAVEDAAKPAKPSQPDTKVNTVTKATLSVAKYTYDGKDKKPTVSVYAGNKKLDASTYTVTFPTNRKNIGTYTVKVTGKADKNCKGTVTATYKIVPKTVKTPAAKAGKKKVTIKWSKVTGGVKYQIAIAKKGGKYNYTVSGTTKSIKKLASKKTYQVKVRAFKKVGSKTYYGGWSKTKSVKVK